MRKLKNLTVFSIGIGSILTFVSEVNAFTITSFSSASFSDTSAGITNYQIENFEDTELLPGLTIEWENPNSGPVSILPSLYKPSVENFPGNPWDGVYALNNNQQERFFPSKKTSELTTFHFNQGANSVGLGISNYEHTGAILYINGSEFINFNELNPKTGASFKSIYIRLDAEQDEIINSIAIKGQPFRGVDDFLVFDHLAISQSVHAVPEPLTILGSGTALAFGAGLKRKLAKAKKK